jgi:energy-converting hydrogenase Eha subunit A
MYRRILGTLRLNSDTYEDVGNDHSAFYQALIIVVIASVAAAAGGLYSDSREESLWDLALAIPSGIIVWGIWVLCIRMVGNVILDIADRSANWGRLFRTTGFALSPGILAVFMFLPVIGDAIDYVVPLWTLLCMIFAVRPGRDLKSTLRTLMVVMLALIPLYLLTKIIGIVLYPLFVDWV